MLEKEVLSVKVQDDDIEFHESTHKTTQTQTQIHKYTSIRCANFQNCPKRFKNYNCI